MEGPYQADAAAETVGGKCGNLGGATKSCHAAEAHTRDELGAAFSAHRSAAATIHARSTRNRTVDAAPRGSQHPLVTSTDADPRNLMTSPGLPAGPAWRRLIAALGLIPLHVGIASALGTAQEAPLTQSILWLPTGFAVAALWWLGIRYWWAVAIATATHRLILDYNLSVVVPESLGSAGEAVLGAFLLRRFGPTSDCSRLRDVAVVFAIAGVVPFVSMFASFLGRSLPGTTFSQWPLLSGWSGWWRMNALGAVTIVPLALSWAARPRGRIAPRVLAEAMALGIAMTAFVWLVMTTASGHVAITLLYLVLPFSLYAALRFGPRGATSIATLTAVLVALCTVHGYGPFLDAPFAERHVAAQLFALTVVCAPLVLGALIAERETTAMRSRGLEIQLQRAQKLEAVGKLAGGVAHDFNNLLTVVRGYAEWIREVIDVHMPPVAERAEVKNAAFEIEAASERGANLTRQLLAFSRQQVLSPQTFDLAVVVTELSGMLRRLIGADIELSTQSAGPAWVRADRGQLEQVLLNLGVNARHAMPNGGKLTIAVGTIKLSADNAPAFGIEPGEHVELTVTDDGVGMDATVRARAFEPFFTTKDPGRGSGLGLAMAYGIVKQSGGAIQLDSELNRGTMIRIWLPRVAPEAPRATEAAPSVRAAGRGATVLVAEDEPAVRDLLRRALVAQGHEVLAAENGEVALALAAVRGFRIDLLVSDLVMPRLGGLDLARRLLELQPQLPVLFVSGYASDVTGLDKQLFPVSDYLQKPFAGDALLAKVEALLAVRRSAC